jgi:hypothetical protein
MAKELEVLFNSKARPKVLKFFFQNEGKVFNSREIAKKIQTPQKIIKSELERLRKINLLARKTQKRKHFYFLNPKFPFLAELRTFILKASPLSLKELNYFLKKSRGSKLVIASGIFLQETKSPTDLLIVGDKIQRSKISKIIKKIESNIGKEIRWSLMTVEEFNYRVKIHDRFLKDIFDHSYKKIIDKLGVPR